jgi:RNA polymerase sigma-70 factor (ECF subfamily)
VRDHSNPASPFDSKSLDDNPESDGELVARTRAGDADAFARLYRRHLPRIYDFVFRRVESREMAQDLTQSIFLRALDSLDSCRDDDRFRAWLFAIARNTVYDTWRSRRRRTVSIDLAAEIADPADSPETHAIRADERRYLRHATASCLTAMEQDILDLRLQGLNDREISAALGRTHGAIRNVQYRMIRKLRAHIDQPHSAPERCHDQA